MMFIRFRHLLLPACSVALATLPASASIESDLNTRWRGAWTVVGIESSSGCNGSYTNNEVRERRVSGKGEYRFGPGELATVYKINLKRKQVEILVNLAEPLLVERREGPFTLYDELDCKVEFQIKLPGHVDSGSVAQLDALIAGLFERHDDSVAARESPNWNGRRREPFPEDYEDTLEDYERWHADQLNAEIAAKIELYVDEAARLVNRLDDEPAYLEGFAAGVDRGRSSHLDKGCETLLSRSVASFVKSTGKDDDRSYRDGYREGQELVFFLEVARLLPRCYVAVPF